MAHDLDMTATTLRADGANPLLVEVTRGKMVESRHRAAYAVVDTEGKVVLQAGDPEALIYPRSAVKPIQALALVETGAADALEVSDQEIALACASHRGEPFHTDTVAAWLARIGCSVEDLECGPHWPYHESSMLALLHAGQEPTAVHNNCSGKHSGFLTVARHLGHPTKGYIKYGHPVQQRVLGILESMTGCDLGQAPWGVDGCGIPTVGVPLGNVALAMARLADPQDQPDARQAAAARVRHAMAAHPEMVSGTGGFCTVVMAETGERALIKTGAEGVYCGAFPDLGVGVALKVDDGAKRAAEVVMGALLVRLGILDETQVHRLQDTILPPVHNRAGHHVGDLRIQEHHVF